MSWKFVRNASLKPHSDLLSQKHWGWGPAIGDLTNPPGICNTSWS